MTPAKVPGRLVLLGHPVAHSLSPAFQGAALRAAGIPLAYVAIDVAPEALRAALADLGAAEGAGNVTIPHKAAVFAACDRVTDLARRAGAVNTFWHEDGRLVGDNTDVEGFDAAVRALGTPREGGVVALLGAGGAASAVCTAVERWPGARVHLVARNAARAAALAARFPALVTTGRDVGHATLVVNATPVGLHDEAMPVPVAALPRDADVMDLVYRPGETAWVRAARAAGHRAADGREMLLQQGAAAFARWFGRAPDLAVMRAALDHAG